MRRGLGISGLGVKRDRYCATALRASPMLKWPAKAKPTPRAAAMLAPALVDPSIQMGGMGAPLGMTSIAPNGWSAGNPFEANAKSSAI